MPQKQKKFKSLKCSPALDLEDSVTCYSNDVLEKMKILWNNKHTDDIIQSDDPIDIWDSLRERFANVCHTEMCWMKQNFLEEGFSKDILKYTFAPNAPKSWSKNRKEWLSSIEIIDVMKHFEKYFNHFTFIGPSPIDFDKKTYQGKCVWDELCNFNLNKMIVNRKYNIGFIFNTDEHTGEGEHWVSMFLNISAKPTPYLFYFDSAGDPIINEIKVLAHRIINQGKEIGIDIKLYENDMEHQKGKSECGMYSLYLIIELLTGNKDYTYFLNNRVPDKLVNNLRKIYFNIDS